MVSCGKYRLHLKSFAASNRAHKGEQVIPGREMNAKALSIKTGAERGKYFGDLLCVIRRQSGEEVKLET